MQYGIIEDFYYRGHKITKIEKIGTVNDYDVYIINNKSNEYGWGDSSIVCYNYDEHIYMYSSFTINNPYFIKDYNMYNLKEVMKKKLIDSNDLFEVLLKGGVNVITWLNFIPPDCININ